MTPEAALREQIAKLEDQLAEAREIIAHYEAESRGEPDAWDDLAHRLGLARIDGRLLRTLYDCHGVARHAWIEQQVWGEELPGPDTLKVRVCKLRRKIGPRLIQTIWGVGYQLTEPGRALVRQRLAAIAREAA